MFGKKEKSEFEIARKKRQNKIAAQRLRNLLIFGIITAVLITAVYFIISEDIIGIIGDRIASSSSAEGKMPVELGGNNVRNLFNCNENIGIVSDASVYLYSQEGKRLLSFSHSMLNPISKSTGRKFLLFDQGGFSVLLRTRDKIIFDKTFDYTIINSGLSSGGWLYVITNAQRYASQVHVWDDKYEKEIFTWSASDDYVVDACVHEENELVATVSLSGDSYGDIVSTVKVFSIESGKMLASKSFTNSSALNIEFDSQGNIKLVCDNMSVLLNKKCEKISSFDYDDKIIGFVNNPEDDYISIAFDRFTKSRTTRVLFLGNGLKMLKDTAVTGNYSLITGNTGNVILYAGGKIYRYGSGGNLIHKYESESEAEKMIAIGDNTFVSTKEMLYPIAE